MSNRQGGSPQRPRSGYTPAAYSRTQQRPASAYRPQPYPATPGRPAQPNTHFDGKDEKGGNDSGKKKNKLPLIISIVAASVLVLAGLGVGAFFFFSKNNQKQESGDYAQIHAPHETIAPKFSEDKIIHFENKCPKLTATDFQSVGLPALTPDYDLCKFVEGSQLTTLQIIYLKEPLEHIKQSATAACNGPTVAACTAKDVVINGHPTYIINVTVKKAAGTKTISTLYTVPQTGANYGLEFLLIGHEAAEKQVQELSALAANIH